MKNQLYIQIFKQYLSYHLKMIVSWVQMSKEAGLPFGVKAARLRKAREHSAEYRRIRALKVY